VVFNFDGAQILRTQLENGAYADVLASANDMNFKALRSEGYLNNCTTSAFARNWQAVIVPNANPGKIGNLSDLARPGVKILAGTKNLAITNLAMKILDKMAADSAYSPEYRQKVLANMASQEANVNLIVSKVALGEVDAAFAHRSEVRPKYAEKVSVIDIPAKYNVKSEYTLGLIDGSKEPDLAMGFIDLVKSQEVRAVLEKHGYEVA
jgi:molybdate transport system substrate-binding protein